MACAEISGNVSQRDKAIEPHLKALELEDSDNESQYQGDGIDELELSDDENIHIAWDSSDLASKRQGESKAKDPLLDDDTVREAREAGNACFRDKKYDEALKYYMDAVDASQGKCSEGERQPTMAVLHSNISAALCKLNRLGEALEHAIIARNKDQSWSKPFYRMATIYLSMGDYAAALEACQQGEALCTASYNGITEFTPLYDKIVIHGSVGGQATILFTGRTLEVRSAGDEAWLGKPAPHIPELDGPLDESTALPSDDVNLIQKKKENLENDTKALPHVPSNARDDGLAQWSFASTKLAIQSMRTSFRCIKEAYDASKDGDKIILLKGTHNGMGETISIKKRILIEGEGQLGETVIDQRANTPTFKIERGGVLIRNLEIDHTGFREAVLIDGNEHVNPLIEHCDIKCSGDDCLNIGGNTRPILRYCRLKGKKAGIRCFESSITVLDRCIIEDCGAQGMEIMDESRVTARRCLIQKCAEDGIVVMSRGKCTLLESKIVENKGPGLDCSGNGYATLSRCEVSNNIGGCWSWDASTIVASSCGMKGGPSHVILVHNDSKVEAKSCEISGVIHAPEKAWSQGLLNKGNIFHDPENPVDFPIESGAFVFVPSPYTSI